MFDLAEFKKICWEKKITLSSVAATLGIAETTLYRKLNRNGDFTRSEIEAIISYLDLDEKNALAIFFHY